MSGKKRVSDESILRFIESYQFLHRRPPTIREIMKAVGLRSTGALNYRLRALFNSGELQHEKSLSRTITRSVS